MDIVSTTIAAVSTPHGRSGVGVIRMSGPAAVDILRKVFQPARREIDFPDRYAVYGFFQDTERRMVLDDGIALVMRAPGSYTGEDTVEITLHGNPVTLDRALQVLCAHGAVPAQRGEFTRRAFLAGKLDLLQAESVLELIESHTLHQIAQARAALSGSLSSELREIAESLKDTLADVEAHLDFDEDEEFAAPDIVRAVTKNLASLREMIIRSRNSLMTREGVKVVIVGKPNVGKSTLFNALARSDRMIVTPHAGTTRDSVSEAICLAGISITLSDTAGLRSDPDPIEDMGIRHTRRLIDSADVLALTLDASSPLDENDLMAIDACERKAAVIVLNKTDLPAHQGPDAFARERGAAVRVSAALGTGIDLLEEALRSAAPDPSAVGDRAALSRRGLACAESAAARLETLVDSITHGGLLSYDIAALEIHGVLESLEEITGESADHGVLDRIFERFCVGK